MGVPDDNEYLWRRPGSPTTAEGLIADAARDCEGPYDDAAEERHQRRLRAMRALGDAERTGTNLMIFVPCAVVVIVVAVLLFLHG